MFEFDRNCSCGHRNTRSLFSGISVVNGTYALLSRDNIYA
jgi:hypothetical protein